MEYRPQEIKAGIMIVVCFVIFIAFIVAISGLDFFKSTKQYYTRFNYTSGLEVGSLVRFGGMEVGKIESMRIFNNDNSLIEFILEVNEDIPVKTNSTATVTSIGLMGEYHINITTGHPDSALLATGNLLKCKDISPLMQIMEPISDIAEQVNETLSQLKQIFGKENQQQIHLVLKNLNALLSDNQQTVTVMLNNLNSVIADFNRMSGKIDNLLDSNEENISSSVKHLEETLIQTKHLMKNIDKMMLDKSFFEASGCKVIGVIINKVFEKKYEKVSPLLKKWFQEKQIPLLGILPYYSFLSSPKLSFIMEETSAVVLNGKSHLDRKIEKVIVGSTGAKSMLELLRKLKKETLLITSSDRIDFLLEVFTDYFKDISDSNKLAGILFSGKKTMSKEIKGIFKKVDIPVLMADKDVYELASTVSYLRPKTTFPDNKNITALKELAEKYIDINKLYENLNLVEVVS